MKVLGREVSDAQCARAEAAMTGEFTMQDIAAALARTGVPTDDYVAERAADRLLQKGCRAKRIEYLGARKWRKIENAD